MAVEGPGASEVSLFVESTGDTGRMSGIAGGLTYPCHPRFCGANMKYHPYRPGRQAVDKGEREVGGTGTAVPLDFARPASRHVWWRREGGMAVH